MTKKPITLAEQVTPDWLTSTLRRNGVLRQGKVTRIIPVRQQATFASITWNIDVLYSDDATPQAPRKLFLKSSSPDLAPGECNPEHLRKEIVFYREIAPAMNELVSVPCYDAAYDPETRSSHLLLRDMSETHIVCLDPGNERNCERAVESLAHLHAFWWDHPRLGDDVGRFLTREEREEEWSDAERRTGEFIQMLGDRLRKPWRETYESVVRSLPGLGQRHEQGRNLTLVHGDAHLGNFLFPRDPDADGTYMIDWQFWHPTIGGTDLAFMIATEWEPEIRRRLEQPLLRRYYSCLLQHGVRDYGWDDCWADYRLSVILVSIFIPVWRWSVFKWEPDMTTVERSMTAFEELGCSELLRG